MNKTTPSLFAPPQPLAARMRPRSLADFVGQRHLVAHGRLLWRSVKAGRLFSSMIFWGPPGTGKTTLARVMARELDCHFASLSAVMSGVADLRRVVEEARQEQVRGRRTVVLIDEIHRFNKAQQDALLPHVEEGLLTLIGATTENPYFEIIGPLLSRARVFIFEPLQEEEILVIPRRAVRNVGQLELVDVVQSGRLNRRAIRTGRSIGDDVEVLSGLSEGEEVVAPEAARGEPKGTVPSAKAD